MLLGWILMLSAGSWKFFHEGHWLSHREELRKERLGTLVPCIDNFSVFVEPLFHPSLGGRTEQAESNYLLCDILHDDGVA